MTTYFTFFYKLGNQGMDSKQFTQGYKVSKRQSPGSLTWDYNMYYDYILYLKIIEFTDFKIWINWKEFFLKAQNHYHNFALLKCVTV